MIQGKKLLWIELGRGRINVGNFFNSTIRRCVIKSLGPGIRPSGFRSWFFFSYVTLGTLFPSVPVFFSYNMAINNNKPLHKIDVESK